MITRSSSEGLTAKEARRRKLLASDVRVAAINNPTDLLVLDKLTVHGPKTRSQLVEITGVARSTLYDSLARLQLQGLINQFCRKSKPGPGRPLVLFESVFNSADRL